MMHVTQEPNAVPVRLWTEDVEPQALAQLRNTARLSFVHPHGVCAMPDVHLGIGATVGSVVATRGAIVPAAVGVDIGCGMAAVRLDGLVASQLPDGLGALRSAIEAAVPTGFERHHERDENHDLAAELYAGFVPTYRAHPNAFAKRKDNPATLIGSQLGTLGGGNHFIELCTDEFDAVWLMLHSGSRGIGNVIGSYFIDLARRDMLTHHVDLPDRDLAYLVEGTEHFNDYVTAVGWAQGYASKNRQEMLRRIVVAIRPLLPAFDATVEAVHCHHNYVERETHFGDDVLVTRKGAISARRGELGIIPGSMGQRSYIVRGLGNADSYHSCSHGAGRRMSRTQARARFNIADLEAQTLGVECRKDGAVVDEIPSAYKDLDVVMANQADLVEIVRTLKAVLCVKGG